MANGLVDQATQQPAAPVEATAQQPAPQGQRQATDEETAAVDAAVQMASEMLHKDKAVSDKIVGQLTSGGADGAHQTVANMTSLLLSKIEDAFQGQLPETVILGVADNIAEMVIEVGEAAGAFEMSGREIERTKGAVVKNLIKTYSAPSEEDAQNLAQQLQQGDVQKVDATFEGM